jgi:hypothetical protein
MSKKYIRDIYFFVFPPKSMPIDESNDIIQLGIIAIVDPVNLKKHIVKMFHFFRKSQSICHASVLCAESISLTH